MNDDQKRAFGGFVAFLLLAGFTWLHAAAILDHQSIGTKSELAAYLTTVTGIIAAVVAMAFNQPVPQEPAKGAESTEGAKSPAEVEGVKGMLMSVKGMVTPGEGRFWTLETMTTLYVLSYFLTGMAALGATLIHPPDEVAEVTRNHGLTCSGLILGIARSFFSIK